MESEIFVCCICGEEPPANQPPVLDAEPVCQNGSTHETFTCHICAGAFQHENNCGTEDLPLCQDCYDRYYTNCSRCGSLIDLEDALYRIHDPDHEEPLCSDCYAQLGLKPAIQQYSYKPHPIFYGTGDRYFGVELEIDEGGELDSNAMDLLRISNMESPLIYCKHDGSLCNGFEIVTHPMTLDFHCHVMPWEDILRKAIELDYLSHKTKTCGLHIHVNRDAFGDEEKEQDICIARILYFVEKHWEELLKFSRRTQEQLNRWAARYGYKNHPMDILDTAKYGYNNGRYSSINLKNRDTIEFRIFQGTLKYNTLIATLQLVNQICDVALFMSDQEVKEMSWTTFVSRCWEPELIQYLKERRIYINEPIEAEEDL